MVGGIDTWMDVKLPDGREMHGMWQYSAHGGEVEFESVVISIYGEHNEWRILDEETYYIERGTPNPITQARKDFMRHFNALKESYIRGETLHDIDAGDPVRIKPIVHHIEPPVQRPEGNLGKGWHGEPGRHSRAAKKGKRK